MVSTSWRATPKLTPMVVVSDNASNGFSSIAVLTTAKSLAQGTLGAIPTGTRSATVQPETQNVRVRCDGTDPTASVGLLLVAGGLYSFSGSELAAAKFIEVTAGATLNIDFQG